MSNSYLKVLHFDLESSRRKNGLHDLMEIMLESMMVAERGEFLAENPGNKGNGYRPGHSNGQGKKKLEFRIPCDR